MGLELVGAGEGPVAVRTPELLLGVESPDVFPDLGVFREALKKKGLEIQKDIELERWETVLLILN